ncbi:MAG: hypothetical protein ACTTKN_11750 [Phocaeicola sp.]|uniref:hypothetical protein n=1 Tax=Phocaeicola sp. TaxID=2773926 RepID=UPI003FA193C4
MRTWKQLLCLAILVFWDRVRYGWRADPFAILLIIVALHGRVAKFNHHKSAEAYEQSDEEKV